MTSKINYLTAIEDLALGKFKSQEPTRSLVVPGFYEIDSILSVQGTVQVGEDYEQRISPKLPWRDLFFAAISRIPNVEERKDFVEAVLNGRFPAIRHSVVDEIKACEDRLLAKTKVPCKGKVNINLSVEGITNEVLA